MASLQARLELLAQRVAAEFKSVRTAIAGRAAADYATATDIWSGSSTTKLNTPKGLADAQKFVALTDAATVSPDLNAGINFKWTRTAARTLGPMTNLKEMWTGTIRLDGPGAITLDTQYDTLGQTLTFQTATGSYDYLDYQVINVAGGAKSVQVRLRKLT